MLHLKHITIYLIIYKCDSNVYKLENFLNTNICFLALLFPQLLEAFVYIFNNFCNILSFTIQNEILWRNIYMLYYLFSFSYFTCFVSWVLKCNLLCLKIYKVVMKCLIHNSCCYLYTYSLVAQHPVELWLTVQKKYWGTSVRLNSVFY